MMKKTGYITQYTESNTQRNIYSFIQSNQIPDSSFTVHKHTKMMENGNINNDDDGDER